MTNFNINFIKASQIEEILNIEHRIFQHTFWTQSQFLDCLNSPEQYLCLQISNENQVMGYAILLVTPSIQEAELLTIGIDLAFQNTTISHNFFNFILQKLKKSQIQTLFLEVRESNIKAQKFYLKHRFEIIGKRKNYYKIHDNQYEHAILMQLLIS